MRKILTILFLIIISNSALAQLYKSHDWDKEHTFIELTENEKKLHSVAIKEKYLIQYYQTVLGQSFKLFETKHSIVRVNTDKGINTHNRVYIPMRNVKKVIDIKARVIQSDGKVEYLNKNNIKELKDVKNYGGYKIFAIEGISKNSQLEYIYTLENRTTSLGSIIVQKNYAVREAEVIIRKPRALDSRIRRYNGFPEMTKKKVEGNKQALTTTIKDIKAMTKEGSASPQANRMKVVYQVAPSFSSSDQMWNNVENNIIANYTSLKPKKYSSLINDYLKFSKTKSRETNAEIINTICEYVTSTYNIVRTRNAELDDLKNIIRKKQATESGIMKVYSCLFNQENIDYEFVLTSDRFNHKFDSSFFSNSNLQVALFYFIEERKYIEPDNVNTRLNFPPEETLSNNALFINNDGRRFKVIDVPDATKSIIQRDYRISVDVDDLIPTVNCDHSVTGYRAKNARGAYKFLKKRDLDRFKSFTTVTGIEDAEFDDFKVKNESLTLATDNTPFNFNYTYKAESLVESLNDDFILNFGKVIGTQNEFYQEAERVNPVELRGLMTYKYNIEIVIPEGFQPKGLEDIKINRKIQIDDKPACLFVSDYIVDNNKIIITVTESYEKLSMDLKYYEDYKSVVNAAFDFSKKSILFKKL